MEDEAIKASSPLEKNETKEISPMINHLASC